MNPENMDPSRPRGHKPRHRRRRAALRVSLIAGLAALVAVGCGSAPDSGKSEPFPPAVQADEPTAAKKPAGVGDGQHAVGEDIKAGTYTTTVPDGGHCYWARLRDFDGELNSILANGNLDEGAKGRFVVKKTDGGVELSGGCEWKRAAK